ncbi:MULTISPECIES: MOSC domain-containing protein [Nocardioides]|uniref:MOSC domain-containing protein n=1 Tax=Nocardioides vastitatis TaxID=2568655 RepID=A0ABW0ZIF1_9ACTN|nr:MOSC domain-containing protein [Nocardioides sp.]THI96917.1 MOSC domain-containing protein [Nocardioides sp.]
MHVVESGFAPVKGTRHRAFDEVAFDDHGPVGDRAFCIVDVERRKVLRTVQHRSLLSVTAHWDGAELALELPTSETVTGAVRLTGERLVCDYWGRSVAHGLTDGPHSALLSDVVGRPVRLAASPRGGVVYGAAVSILTTASLRDLSDRTGRPDLLATASRFRMTMVVDAGDEPYVEDGWFGRRLSFGGVTVAVEAAVPRCGVIDLDPTTGAKDGSLLKALAGYRPSTGGEPWFGVDAHVVVPGTIRPGDPVTVS